MALLEVRNLTKRFGGLVAVDRFDFDIHEGEILGLIGPNGAGKTTVFNMVAGSLRPTMGTTLFSGKNITRMKTNKIAALGAIRTFQITTLFGEMTVIQNVILGAHKNSSIGFWGSLLNTPNTRKKERISYGEAEGLLRYMGLSEQKNVVASNLSHGHQRLLEVAIALAGKPKLLLLDEPLTGMNQEEVEGMLERIKDIRNDGKTILLVEHNMRAVTSICDRIVVLSFGKKIAEGTPQEIVEKEEVIKAYLGTAT